jgi:Concanavalin A-like lectin/glucanases superfamily
MKTQYQPKRNILLWCFVALSCMQLAAWGATLTNRYSFTTDASDSVGGKNGTLIDSPAFSGGAVTLDGISQYVALPDNIISNYNAISIEAWVTPDVIDGVSNPWKRIWDFGVTPNPAGGDWFFYCRMGNTAEGILASYFMNISGAADNVCDARGVTKLTQGVKTHVVWTSDPKTLKAKLYFNGALVAANNETVRAASNTLFAMTTTNNWIGRSAFSADGFTPMTVDEFRIWDGALNQLQVAALSQAGPDTISTNYGTITNIVLSVSNTNLVQGTSRQANCVAGASGLTNTVVNVRDQVGVVYTSSNTNVATVDSNARITGVGTGSATITATLAGKSSSVAVNVTALATALSHRYSFNEGAAATNAIDSVGGKNGTYMGTAVSDGTQVQLDGGFGTYVDLPAQLINATNVLQGAVTFVAWGSFGANFNWPRLFDFGNIAGPAGVNYIYFSPAGLVDGSRLQVEISGAAFSAQNVFTAGGLSLQTNVQIAAVFNPNPNRRYLGLSVNGATVASRFDVSTTLADVDDQFSFIGRSLFSIDPYLVGSVDEFRIYNGELGKPEIAAAYQYGSTTNNVNPGVCTNFAAGFGGATMFLEQNRQASPTAAFTLLTNKAVNVAGDAGCTLRSSDPTIVSIDSNSGLMRALKPGTATLTAIYKTFTNSQAINVVVPTASLAHRYSFDEASGTTASDSIGGANGTLNGGSSFSGGSVVLDGASGYVALPAGTISALGNNITFETWLTDNASATWSRIFDFGSPGDFIFLTGNEGTPLARFDTSSGGAFNSTVALPFATPNHLVLTYGYNDNYSKLYLNGALVGSGGAPKALSTMVDTNNWLGQSKFADPFFGGSYDEVRLYSGILTEATIARDFALGPSQRIANVPLSFSASGGNVTLSWPNYAAAFTLQSSPALGGAANWNPAGGTVIQAGTNYQTTIPATGAAQFFRLRQ